MKTKLNLKANELEEIKEELIQVVDEHSKVLEQLERIQEVSEDYDENSFDDSKDGFDEFDLIAFKERELVERIEYLEEILKEEPNPKAVAQYEREKFERRIKTLENEENSFFREKGYESLKEKFLKIIASNPEEYYKIVSNPSEDFREQANCDPIIENAIKCLTDLGVDYEIDSFLSSSAAGKLNKNKNL